MRYCFRVVAPVKGRPGSVEPQSAVRYANVLEAVEAAAQLPKAFVGCYSVDDDGLEEWLFDLDRRGCLDITCNGAD